MAIYGYTKNYKLIKPQYDTDTWHDYEYDNLDTIDAVLSAIYASGNWKGFWATNTAYVVGDVVIDRDTDTMYKVMVDHTTSAGSFAAEQTAHPDYYELWSPNNLAESWATKTDDKVSNEDYSAKAYAISSGLIDDGSAKEWAIGSGAIGNTNEYSAKKYATDAHNDYISIATNANLAAVGSNIDSVNTVGPYISNVNTVADSISSVNTVAGVSTDVTTVASIASSVPTVANNDANITTVATNISDVNTAASNMAAIQAAPTAATNAANSATAAASSATQALLAAQTAQKYIGETVFSILPISAAGYHLLDGSLISGQGVYADFVSYIASLVSGYPNLFVQETVWQSSVASFGVCGKFVYDANAGTVRLPKVTGFVEGTLDASALGDLVQAGLPNITGTAKYNKSEIASSDGALKSTATGTQALYSSNGAGSSLPGVLNFNASLSNGIYGRSTTVQPQSIKGFMYIVIAASAKSTVQADIDSLMSEVNAIVSTLSSNKYVTDCYVNGNNWYRVWSDGWCEQGGYVTGTGLAERTVNFLKPYKDNDYTLIGSLITRSHVALGGVSDISIISKTKDSFVTYTDANIGFFKYWFACGYII